MSKVKSFLICCFFMLPFLLPEKFIHPAHADGNDTLKRLEKIIEQQQKQIEAQARAIEQLQKQIGEIKGEQTKSSGMAESDTPKGFIKAKSKNTDVTLYGQVNRGILISDDGDDTTVYQVDNDNSSTRIGLIGTARATDSLEAGAKIEIQFESNSSIEVNQSNRSGVGSNNFTKRHLDTYLKSAQLGKISLGFGSTASDTSCENDLSGTSLVGYSDVELMAGGQFFYDNTTQRLSTTTVASVFSNMDGLGRDDRIRYDTPSFHGLYASGSYIADGGGDAALRYEKAYASHQVTAAIAFSNPGGRSATLDYQLGSSLSVLNDSGISLSLAGGQQEFKTDSDGDGLFYYGKLGYQVDYFSIGKSYFSIDFGVFEDIAVKNDEAQSFGFQLVQDFKNWNTEYYLGLRQYSLDRDSTDYDDINTVLSGIRVKF